MKDKKEKKEDVLLQADIDQYFGEDYASKVTEVGRKVLQCAKKHLEDTKIIYRDTDSKSNED